jgi:TamB, inner membrane protein subunit of TAM complex
MPRSRRQRIALGLTRALVYPIAFILLVVGLVFFAFETGWGKNQLRALIIRQANQYLTATLEIDRLQGSLVRGLELTGVRLSLDGRMLVAIDGVSLSYSIRELIDQGTVIRRIRITRPRVSAGRLPDGRWDLSALVRREARDRQRTGPSRPITLRSIEVVDGTVVLRDPLKYGPAYVPMRYDALNLSLSYAYQPVAWTLNFTDASWKGDAENLTVNKLAGVIASGPGGLSFTDLKVQTPGTTFTLDGRIIRDVKPSVVDLRVIADRFAFQEWTGVIRELRNIVVDAAFDVSLKGPLAQLATGITLHSNGGGVHGALVLDTTVPGWRGTGAVELTHFDLSRWFNLPDRPSDVSGHVDFNLTRFAPKFPRGSYVFKGGHTAFLGYKADKLNARGTITDREVRIAEATGVAYGADISVENGDIAIDRPFAFHFAGTAGQVDLRALPEFFPVPHVESRLAFDYDVTGQFASTYVDAHAVFAASEFLGASVGAGTIGSVDTSVNPFRYSGEGDLDHVVLNRFGEGLEIGWMQDPRYRGTLSGHFHAEGSGADLASMTLTGGGRLSRADLFDGRLEDADVSVHIAAGSLEATYEGRFSSVDPSIALADRRFEGSLNGTGRARIAVRDLLLRSPLLADYDIDATATLTSSTVRGVQLDSSDIDASLADSALTVRSVRAAGAAIDAQGAGMLLLDGQRSSQFDYDIARVDLSLAGDLLGREVFGEMTTTGRLTGPTTALRLEGEATANRFESSGVKAMVTTASYDVTIPPAAPADLSGRVTGRASFVELFNQSLEQVEGTATYAGEHLTIDVKLRRKEGEEGALTGAMAVHRDRRALDLSSLTVTLLNTGWQLVPAAVPQTIAWDEAGITLPALIFRNTANADARIDLSGTWREDGKGALRITATHVFLDAFARPAEQPARYGGVIDLDATVRGTRDHPTVTSQLTVSNGRIRRFSYEKLSGRLDYTDGMLDVDLRLDQSPVNWLTAVGTTPVALFDRELPEKPMKLAVQSSAIGLGLVEGRTNVVRDVAGQMIVDLTVVGTSHDPHFTGSIELTNAGFLVTASGARYKNGQAALRLAADRLTVQQFHLEDSASRTLDMKGSLGTHELRVADLEMDAVASRFEVLRNEFGRVEVDARLSFRGQFESPSVTGTITVASGELNVNEILDRTLLRPYATEAASPLDVDAILPFNPWQRLGLGIELRVPNTVRLTGEDVQIGAGTPLGLGSFNLRVLGDLYLSKDPNQPLYVTGSLDSVTGTYAFQGRRFDVDPTSSIDFRGDLTPEVFVTVKRIISGVETRVTIAGELSQPEIRLASTPPLESSDILSLIVFNTTTNQLSATQQADLAVRAGTLAAGFLAGPLITALERSLGLDILEIEAAGDRGSARVTIGDELAPGLVARFSRQFGRDEYDEATLEYALSRILRIRGTFSDAGTLTARSPFRRVERAGIDLIMFFSF